MTRNAKPNAARTLGLKVPEQSPPPPGSPLVDPGDTEEWIASLPLANIGETARQIYTALLDFNRHEIPDLARARIAELLRPTVDYLCDSLRRHYVDAGFPLSSRAWKTGVLARELNSELATAYKLIVERMLSGATERFDRKLLVIALHRGLYYLSRVYLQSCLTYTRPPTGLWKEVNAMYAFARQNRIHRIPVKVRGDEKEEVSTLEERYKALLLLASTMPARLRQSQIERVADEALRWAGMTRFVGVEETAPRTAALNINLAADEGPVHNALRAPAAGRHIAVLDLDRLLGHLRGEIERRGETGSTPPTLHPLSTHLLRGLLANWKHPAERGTARTRLHFSLRILVGFRAIHQALEPAPGREPAPAPSGAAGPNINAPSLSTPSAFDPASFDDSHLSLVPTEADLQGSSSLLGGSLLTGDTSSLLTPGQTLHEPHSEWSESRPLESADTTGVEVTTINESTGGYCIQWPVESRPPRVRVGELLGITGRDEVRQSLAVIRWMHSPRPNRLELGVQLLSSRIEATHARIAPGSPVRPSGRNEPVPCLLLDLHADRRGEEPPSLVFHSTGFSSGTELLLDALPPGRRIRLTRLIDASSAHVRMAFEFVDAERTDSHEDKPYNEFDSLWNSL